MTLNGHFALKSVSRSATNVVSGSIRFMQIFAGVRWRNFKWEWGRRKWRFSVHSVTVFRTFYIHGHMTAFRWYGCQWSWAYFKVIGLFHIKFLKYGMWYGKSYYRLLIGNHTLAFDWCHSCWPCSTFEGRFSIGFHFHVHFSNPWHAFASHGVPTIAELLVFSLTIPSINLSPTLQSCYCRVTLLSTAIVFCCTVEYARTLHTYSKVTSANDQGRRKSLY